MTYSAFKKEIWSYYKKNRRSFPWREDLVPYNIVVSEIMLQQTQALRVVSKFQSFIQKFPDFETLAHASTAEVLKEWQGLGYNRRGLNLKRLAEQVVTKHNGKVPKTAEELIELPGIGPGTVGSILAFVHNIPYPFIETNIRTVYLHFFFKDKEGITDKKLFPLIAKTLDNENPREWYYALMDYGVMLKKLHKNPSRKSLHYKKQSSFKGSNRELRSQILKKILETPDITETAMTRLIDKNKYSSLTPQAVKKNIDDLIKEGFIVRNGKKLQIKV
jgi:A/G-specific adenine glycosylase